MAFLTACNTTPDVPVVRHTTAMNTYVNISIYDADRKPAETNAWIDSCFSEIQRVERFATDYSDSSEVGIINTHAGIDTVRVSEELVRLLLLGLEYGKMSDWKLDITIRPLVQAWNFISSTPHVPSKEVMNALLPLVDARRVSILGDRVYLPIRGMGIDIGSYGKGHAINQAMSILRRAGYRQYIVDIGGKLGVYWEGSNLLDSTVVEVLIRHPRKEGEYLGKFRIGSGSVSTSGDYERYFMQDGVRYHHLLDPSTGYPMRGIVSVTLVARDPLFADALSTIVFLLGREKGMSLMSNTTDVEGMIVYESGDSLAYDLTPGFKRCLKPADPDD